MALASAGASTPFITNTPSNAVTLASVAARLTLGLMLGLGLGLGLAAGLPSALAVFAALSLDFLASLFSATTGAAVMANTSTANNQLFSFNIEGVLLVRARLNREH